ncbi:hypothetical protein [Rossellomorea sp. LJF3]|uniref:hypothetical protein n=1 Tax=Rossellomorea sp. LJF3 TaxID=3126099 RepID=UPI00300C5292
MKDLWGFNKLTKNDIKSLPQGILKEQAELFEKKTDDMLFLKTPTRSLKYKVDEKYGLATNFEIVAPYLDGYSYTLFTMYSSPENDYPVALAFDADDIDGPFASSDYECKNETQFLEKLQEILSSQDTINIIKSLYSKSIINGKDEGLPF